MTRLLIPALVTAALATFAVPGHSVPLQQSASLLLDATGHMGDPGELRVKAEPGEPLLIFLDTDPGPVEVPPWGFLEIGFSPSLQVAVGVALADGWARFPFVVPALPPLLGTVVYSQAVLVDPQGGLSATNSVHLVVTSQPADPPAGNPGLGRLQRPARVADLSDPALPLQESSFDRLLGNDDGFSGIWSYLAIEDGERVVFDRPGPGSLDSIKVTFMAGPGTPISLTIPGADDYRLRFWFDDEPVPRLDVSARGLFEGSVPGFDAPLVLDDAVNPGAAVCHVPMPFEHRLRITTGPDDLNQGRPHFHNFRWRRFPEGTPIVSWTQGEELTCAQERLASAGSGDPKVDAHSPTTLDGIADLDLSPQVPMVLLDGPGWITSVQLRPLIPDPSTLSRTRLQAFYEGEAEPSFDVPLALLSGAGPVPGIVVLGLMAGQQADGTIYFHYPMPYESQVELRLVVDDGLAAGPVEWSVAWRPSAMQGKTARLASIHTPPTDLEVGSSDHLVASVWGSGRLVRVVLRSTEGITGSRLHLEGDERITVDTIRTPIHGTGTEDFFNWGFYDGPLDFPFSAALHGAPEGPAIGSDWTTQYRDLLADAVDFGLHLNVAFEHGPTNNVAATYESLALLYLRDEADLVMTDFVEVGDVSSENAHGYLVQDPANGAWWPAPDWTLVVPGVDFTGYVFENDLWVFPPFVDVGRRLETLSGVAFDVSIDPDNQGVRLVRLADQGLLSYPGGATLRPHKAAVYVDGVWAGIWSHPRNNAVARWVEDAFELPPSMTVGRTQIRVELRPEPLFHWNEFQWRVYSRR